MLKRKRLFLMFLILTLLLVSGCADQDKRNKLKKLETSEIEKIQGVSMTGGKDGSTQYKLTKDEIGEFTELLRQVELGDEVGEERTRFSGAASYYTITFTNEESIKISPGTYFMIENSYYVFENYDELWEKFVRFHSLK